MSRISLAELNALPGPEYLFRLGELYEYSPWVVEESCGRRPFASLKAMQATLESIIYGATQAEQLSLLRAHPDLAAKIEQVASLTEFSRGEQTRAGFAELPAAQLKELRFKLEAYRERFAHPFILCVSEHNASETLPILGARLEASIDSERIACLAQVARIGWHRLSKLVTTEPLQS
ncbi:2-oxo-4-hydroxy-4-carboxy-5-ureidoimidazoline decarboxylase [Pelagicoccus sp. SDUM812003]|uniref:2-oxo-4-hydroxy-4-carboxy-5-ureidoimidazoline decarboxylase n=1 Tax=Pelagicoccus sp. SDUM812003 TaxID=3041267 RepID=UPI00280CAFBC|nr:2-oxo-4-hydroxy-4-carboxy-5-ureidoimidazoline decarboxylase [Pelagicoccus sp. SDUM812003]MDQ8205467.1 2-oxo-4-hydroxy-4-carboxy-5-ureidoimidazoline decarboxylase [Pelagicoccus sp. SDUM812003]